MVICLKWGANGPADVAVTPSSLASLKSGMAFTFLVSAYPGCPGKEAVKRLFFVFVLQRV